MTYNPQNQQHYQWLSFSNEKFLAVFIKSFAIYVYILALNFHDHSVSSKFVIDIAMYRIAV